MRIFLAALAAGTLAADAASASSLMVLEDVRAAKSAPAAPGGAIEVSDSILELGAPAVTDEMTAAVGEEQTAPPRGRPPLILRGGVTAPVASDRQPSVAPEEPAARKAASTTRTAGNQGKRISERRSSAKPQAAPRPAVPSSLPRLGAPE